MTVTTTLDRQEFPGDGSNKNFPFNFKFFDNSQIYVYLIDPLGEIIGKVLNVDYTLSGAMSPLGGTVIMSNAPPLNYRLLIRRILQISQPTSIRNQGAFFPAIHEDVFDRLTMMIQQANAVALNSMQLDASGSLWDFKGHRGINAADPIDQQDVVTKNWVGSYIDSVSGLINTTSGIAYDAGTLYEYLRSSVARSVLNVAALRILSKGRNNLATTRGYYTAGDNGEGFYYCDTTDITSADNGGSIIVAADGGRWKLIPNNGVLRLRQFGAKGDGVSNDSPPVQACLDYAASFGSSVSVLAHSGNFLLDTAITLKASVSIIGEETLVTQFRPGTAGMTMFTLAFGAGAGANMEISNCSIYCGSTTGVKGMQFTNCNRVTLRNVLYLGCFINFEFDRGGLNRILDCTVAGTASLKTGQTRVVSNTDTDYGCVFSVIENFRIENSGLGTQSPVLYFRRAVGIDVNGLITNDGDITSTGIVIENDCQGINFNGGVVVGYRLGMVFQKGGGIDKAPIFNQTNGLNFDQCAVSSIVGIAGKGNQFNGGSITSSDVGTGTAAIALQAGFSNSTFKGQNVSGYYSPGGSALVMTGTVGTRITGMKADSCDRGIIFDTGNTWAQVDNCDLHETTSPIVGSTAGVGNRVSNISGFSAAALVTSPAMPASGVSVTNNFGVFVRVFINGGTISTIAINGVASGFTTGAMLTLAPGESLSITYSVAPTWNWIGI